MRDYIYNKYLSYWLIIQSLLVGWASNAPTWIEKYYSRGIYIYISAFWRRLLGWVPFSTGDIFYFILLLIVLQWLRISIRNHFSPLWEHIYRAGAFLSIIFFFFHLFWGLNYYRVPLAERMGITKHSYDSTALLTLTKKHIRRLNTIHRSIEKNDSLPVDIPYKRKMLYKSAYDTYNKLHYKGEDFSFKHRSIKSSLFSLPLSYMGFSGYLNPFTGETQINRKIPKVEMPFVIMHEMAHQYGYAAEDEANLLGYISCMESDDIYFNYSAELIAVQYLLYEIYRHDSVTYEQIKKSLLPGVEENFQLLRDFWDSYHSPVEPVFQKIYDGYLKVNRQKTGIHSYTEFVGYLMEL